MKKIIIPIVFVALLSSCTWITPTPTPGPSGDDKEVNIDFYCVNDFHGHINTDNGRYNGVSKLSGYLNASYAKTSNEHVFVNAGDLWQETFDSATNQGLLLTEAFVEMGCEAMALGNHEFDWGQEVIAYNRNLATKEDKSMKFLGCNIYNFDESTMTVGDHASELCDKYKVIYRNDIKIGLIGAIGQDQLGSITSTNWTNLTFVDFEQEVKDVSDYLRTEENCDVIVAMIHTPGSSNEDKLERLSANSPLTNKKYVDVGFLGHSHREEHYSYNKTHWTQSRSQGEVIGKQSITVKKSKGSVSVTTNSADPAFGEYQISKANNDPKVDAIINKYLNDSTNSFKNEVVGRLDNCQYNGYVYSEIGGILAKATYDKIESLKETTEALKDVNVDVVINNGARSSVYLQNRPNITRGEVFNLIPFTNKTIIAKVKGRDIINECLNYSNPYYIREESLYLESNATYTVAVIDYMLLHKNVTTRTYNYFPTYANYEENPIYTIQSYSFELVCGYLLANESFDIDTLSSGHYTGLRG